MDEHCFLINAAYIGLYVDVVNWIRIHHYLQEDGGMNRMTLQANDSLRKMRYRYSNTSARNKQRA